MLKNLLSFFLAFTLVQILAGGVGVASPHRHRPRQSRQHLGHRLYLSRSSVRHGKGWFVLGPEFSADRGRNPQFYGWTLLWADWRDQPQIEAKAPKKGARQANGEDSLNS